MARTEDNAKRTLEAFQATLQVATYGRKLWNLFQYRLDVERPDTQNLSREELEQMIKDYTSNLYEALNNLLDAGHAFADGFEFTFGTVYASVNPQNAVEQERAKATAIKVQTVLDGTYFKPIAGLDDVPSAKPPYEASTEKTNVSKNDLRFHSMQAANALYMHYGNRLLEMPTKLNRDFVDGLLKDRKYLELNQQHTQELFDIVSKLAFACDLIINFAMTILGSRNKKDAWKFLRNHYGHTKMAREQFAYLISIN